MTHGPPGPGPAGHAPGGHDHLSHLPDGAQPAVFAARADVAFAQPAHADQLEAVVTKFLAALSEGLAGAGCTLVGHIKGTVGVDGHGDLAFHVTALGAAPAVTGGIAGLATQAVLTLNVIVFGVDDEALPVIVTRAWSQAVGAGTVWRP